MEDLSLIMARHTSIFFRCNRLQATKSMIRKIYSKLSASLSRNTTSRLLFGDRMGMIVLW